MRIADRSLRYNPLPSGADRNKKQIGKRNPGAPTPHRPTALWLICSTHGWGECSTAFVVGNPHLLFQLDVSVEAAEVHLPVECQFQHFDVPLKERVVNGLRTGSKRNTRQEHREHSRKGQDGGHESTKGAWVDRTPLVGVNATTHTSSIYS